MQHIKYITVFALLTACGSGFSANAGTEMAGMAGIENSTAGKNSEAGAENIGGSNNAGMAGNNIAGLGGNENISGSGGMSGSNNLSGSSGMNSAGQSGNNTAGSSGGTTCNPITCDDYSFSHGKTADPNIFKKSCGFIDDGCGHKIQCGGCPDFTKCGDVDYSYVPSTDFITHFQKNSSDANTCNGNCEFAFSQYKGYNTCKNISGFDASVYSIMLYCFNPSITSIPSTHCKDPKVNPWPVGIENDTKMIQIWCCDDSKL